MTETRWTREQADAIRATGHTLLAANAGTGKTTTVVGKILWHLGLGEGVIDDTGEPLGPCPAEHRLELPRVAAITFTEKAAHDLKRKLRDAIRSRAPELLWDLDRAAIGTIHSFCAALLREHSLRFGLDPSFGILDDRETTLEQAAIAREVLFAAAEAEDPAAVLVLETWSVEGFTYQSGAVDYVLAAMRDLRWHAGRYRGWLAGEVLDRDALKQLAACWDAQDDVTAERCDALLRLARRTLERWNLLLATEGLRDFDALVLDLRDRLLDRVALPALAAIRANIGLLVIDEFQDTDGAQRDIAFRIAGLDGSAPEAGPGPALFLVGDPKQSIYGFRGADITVWNEVRASLGGAELTLSRNFRSDPAVVDYVNRACEPAMDDTARAVAAELPLGAVRYHPLVPARSAIGTTELEWLVADGTADDRREREAEMVAARIRDVVVDRERGDTTGSRIVDPESGELRDCSYRDVAVLFRNRTGVEEYAQALARYGVPFYLAGGVGLSKQLEILDVLNLLTLVANPLDDLAAFAFLRSPFVGLRDEVLAAIRLLYDGPSLLRQAREFLDRGEWFAAPEHPLVTDLERQGLAEGLALLEELSALQSRLPLDEIARLALERTGYPLHLLLLPQPEPRLANLQRFLRVLQGYRTQSVGSFLELWKRWEDRDLGLPQAPLYSKRDDVVTLSTIHSAKGLEWPVVFLVDLNRAQGDETSGELWSDRELGPIIAPSQKDRGARADRLCGRRNAEDRAEESRVFYVATTRARDRLILTVPSTKPKGMAEWAMRGFDRSTRRTNEVPEVERPPLPPEPVFDWLDRVREEPCPEPLVGEVRPVRLRYTQSASELMTARRKGGRGEARLRYLHGCLPVWRFAPAAERDGVPADVRGTLIHGVLEKIEDEAELAELLDVAVGALDSPELETYLAAGTRYRDQLEEEIRTVVASEEWRWYVDGDYWRELWFVQFRGQGKWRIGAFDLYRSGLIVDFKTHDVTAARAAAEAAKYRLQALTYRTVVRTLVGGDAEVRFHFTRPNVVV